MSQIPVETQRARARCADRRRGAARISSYLRSARPDLDLRSARCPPTRGGHPGGRLADEPRGAFEWRVASRSRARCVCERRWGIFLLNILGMHEPTLTERRSALTHHGRRTGSAGEQGELRAERCGRKRRAIYFFLAAGFLATVFFGCGGRRGARGVRIARYGVAGEGAKGGHFWRGRKSGEGRREGSARRAISCAPCGGRGGGPLPCGLVSARARASRARFESWVAKPICAGVNGVRGLTLAAGFFLAAGFLAAFFAAGFGILFLVVLRARTRTN